MPLNDQLICAEVPLRNHLLTHSHSPNILATLRPSWHVAWLIPYKHITPPNVISHQISSLCFKQFRHR